VNHESLINVVTVVPFFNVTLSLSKGFSLKLRLRQAQPDSQFPKGNNMESDIMNLKYEVPQLQLSISSIRRPSTLVCRLVFELHELTCRQTGTHADTGTTGLCA
jgi:hypothetical protein